MRTSELRRALVEEFGSTYAPVLERDHFLTSLGGTVLDAVSKGIEPRQIWLAVCEDFEVPVERRHGRGLINPKKN